MVLDFRSIKQSQRTWLRELCLDTVFLSPCFYQLSADMIDPGTTDEQGRLQRELLQEAPWRQDPGYFQHVRISSLASSRMAEHAREGGPREVMGIMTGYIGRNHEFLVVDSYALPVEATETRVNAMGDAYGYIVQYLTSLRKVGRNENIVGWYHSHPGYGCWLSRIDIDTQMQNQAFQDPFLAVVIDPLATSATKHVEIGAFRTTENDYYRLPISYFTTKFDTATVTAQTWPEAFSRAELSRPRPKPGPSQQVVRDVKSRSSALIASMFRS